MNLIISGIALSNQWWPSLTHFEESLPQKREPSPALVEQVGEVIYQALIDAQSLPGSKLSIIIDQDQIELGQYLPLINKDFTSVDILDPRSPSLYAQIGQASELIREDAANQVVLCELSLYGSAAIVLSSSEDNAPAHVSLKTSAVSNHEPYSADYVIIDDPADSSLERYVDLLHTIFQDRPTEYPISLGCKVVNARSSEMISLIQTILAIKNKIIPACSFDLDSFLEELTDIPAVKNKEFRPWLSRGPGFTRSALLVYQRPKGKELDYFFLEEIKRPEEDISVRSVAGSDPLLFPVGGENEKEIIDRISSLEDQVLSPDSLKTISTNAYAQYIAAEYPFRLSLLAGDRDQLSKELAHAKSGVNRAFQTGEDWTSPNGSYFTTNPLGKAKIAFVYPGAFNSYPGMAKELFFSFQGLHNAANHVIPNLSHSLADEFVYLRSSRSAADDTEDQIMADFYQHPNQLIESGISLSVLHTLILDQVFDLRPDAALGYSLGEISMLWANRVWQNAKDRSDSWKESTLFKEDLVGEMKAVRNYWPDKDLPQDFWRSYILKADRELARAACDRQSMAFLSIDNSPNEVVIVGEAEACQNVIAELKCRALPMPFNAVIHNPAMKSCLPAFADLYHNDVNPRSDISFYTAAGYRILDLEKEDLAQTMADMTCNPFDFPRLVDAVYEDGARIFIEVGPQKTCSRWIEKILEGKPHAVVPINKKYQPDLHGVLKVLAMLLSHQVEFDLAKLYPGPRPSLKAEEGINQPPPEIVKSSDQATASSPVEAPEQIPDSLAGIYMENLEKVSADLARSHQDFLKNQQIMTRNLARMMKIQAGNPPSGGSLANKKAALYTREQIQAFTKGDHRLCFGDTFSGFGDRRIPRLPNGDLQFIDRVVHIGGHAEQIEEGSTLISEFDLPEQTWYLNGNPNALPYVALMEIALQPCGFLSAYMGSIKGRENQDLYFRNLDGEGTLISWPDSPGRTITNQVRLLSSSSLEDVIIQNYAFDLTWGGEPFYQGTSSFGYFPLAMLENQAGLDAGRHPGIWQQGNPGSGSWQKVSRQPDKAATSQAASLPAIDQIWISPSGGNHAAGYLYYRHSLRESDWFYQAHFFQDPVMPGSLGVETMVQALIASLPSWDLPGNLQWKIQAGGKTSWKYRGQITPDIRDFEIELHIKNISQTPFGWEISADGLLWKDSKPIYKVEDISLAANGY